jgi:hypothetical protein
MLQYYTRHMTKAMSRQSFKLRGRRFELSREDVEERMKGVEAKSVAKYRVRIGGTDYPPKQALSVAIKQPLVEFTTMDAARILKKLGFEITGPEPESRSGRTLSERLFETYLESSGLADFSFEASQEGTSRKPDYSLRALDQELLFEVKQFDQTNRDFDFHLGAFDPYAPVREKIESARKKFKDLDGFCCSLVLYNNDKPLVDLDWQIVYAAMLGNLALQFPVNKRTGAGDLSRSRNVFHGGGKMFWYDKDTPVKPQNTTISSILVLQHFMVGQKRFEIAVRQQERLLGRQLELPEFMDQIDRTKGTSKDLSISQPRVIVHENPFGRIPLPNELFRGPYDERYAAREGRIVRVFCGDQLAELEREEKGLAGDAPGFHPVPIRGEDLSTTISRDRR